MSRTLDGRVAGLREYREKYLDLINESRVREQKIQALLRLVEEEKQTNRVLVEMVRDKHERRAGGEETK
ncbi:hypothetical protein HC928_02340 [bacterium]|nr:hypothetical protein [bacterium]